GGWGGVSAQVGGGGGPFRGAAVPWGGQAGGRPRLSVRACPVLAAWGVGPVLVWSRGRALPRRYGRGEATDPGQRDRTIAATIDGVGLVLVPILAVWLIGKLLSATSPPPPIDLLVPPLTGAVTSFLLVGVTTG